MWKRLRITPPRTGEMTRHALHRERGAALLETSLFALLLTFLAFGAVEMGALLKQADGVASSVRSGARQGTSTGAAPIGDAAILSAMQESSGHPDNGITRVIVYKATNNPGEPPVACRTAAV